MTQARSTSLHICLVADALPGVHRQWSGQERMCWRLGENLRAAGHRVSFLTVPAPPPVPLPPDAHVVRQGLPALGWLTCHLPLDVPAMLSAGRALRRLRPDVVHIHAKTLYYPALLAARRLGLPAVFTVVDQYLFCPNQTLMRSGGGVCTAQPGGGCAACLDWSRYLRQPLLRGVVTGLRLARGLTALRAGLMRRSARSLSAVIALSETSRRRVVAWGVAPERVHTVYEYDIEVPGTGGAGLPLFDVPTVVYIGALTAPRGAAVAVRAMARVVQSVPGARLLMVGSVWDALGAKVKALPAELGIEAHVEFLGQLPNEQVVHTLRRSHVCVVPLQFPNEFGPMNLVEARYLGKPVVASRIGATPEFVHDGADGFLVPPDRLEAFAEKIVFLLTHPEAARAMGARAAEATRHLKPGHYVPGMVEVYRNLAKAE